MRREPAPQRARGRFPSNFVTARRKDARIPPRNPSCVHPSRRDGKRFGEGWLSVRTAGVLRLFTLVALVACVAKPLAAQESDATTRQAVIEQEQAAKVPTLHPYVLSKGEKLANKAEDILVSGGLHWHPFFTSAYSGGGFTLGMGYMNHVSAYNTIDVRGSYTITGYKRIEAEFMRPAAVQPPRLTVDPRRLARSDAGRLLWTWHVHVG